MKKFRYLMICLAAVLTGLYFVSCSSDDDDNGGNGSVVGTWLMTEDDYDESYYPETLYFVLFADGTGYEVEYRGDVLRDVDKFTYSYNAAKKEFKIGNDTMEVLSISSSKVVLNEGEGKMILTKVNKSFSREELDKMGTSYSSSN